MGGEGAPPDWITIFIVVFNEMVDWIGDNLFLHQLVDLAYGIGKVKLLDMTIDFLLTQKLIGLLVSVEQCLTRGLTNSLEMKLPYPNNNFMLLCIGIFTCVKYTS